MHPDTDLIDPLNTEPPYPLVDRFGRRHRSLRVSVTDRCNLRCTYCMPEFGAQFAARETLLTFEEITRIVQLLISDCGLRDVRLTGGEPLIRNDIVALVGMLSSIDGLEDLSLTTNGVVLDRFARPLRDAGLRRLNISLDTLNETTFQKISRRKGIDNVIRGIDAAISAGFEQIKLNTTAVRGVTETEIISLVRFAIERNVQIRFIEFMPLDTDRNWNREQLLDGQTIRDLIASEFGPLQMVPPPHPSQPATDYILSADQKIGIIESVSKPFCQNCDRLRLTADGAIRNCLFAHGEFALRDRLRDGATNAEVREIFQLAVAAKAAGHGIDDPTFLPPQRPMYSIGG